MNAARILAALVAAALLPGCTEHRSDPPPAPPVVAGLATATPDRPPHPGLDARVRGMVLLGELGCVACHAQGPDEAAVEVPRGPDLATVGSRVQADHLERFLEAPLTTEPGTRMPDLLRDREPAARRAAAAALAHYLRSLAPPIANVEPVDPAAAARGRDLFHTIGCVACHAPRDAAGAELPLPAEPLGRLHTKYVLASLRSFLLAPHDARPAARMPDLRLSPSEAHDLSHYLLAGDGDAPPATTAAIDPAQVRTGRALFAERGCAACHALADAERGASRAAKPLRSLDPTAGCLSGRDGPWPHYPVTDDQRADLRTAMAAIALPLPDEARIRQLLTSRNCTACHQRDELGGIAGERQPFVTSNDPSLGEDGRVPPTLSGVGSKLQRGWLVDTIAHGQSIRPYLRTRMPGFGAEFAEELAALLARTDELPPLGIAALPDDEQQARAVLDLGRELVGDKGMNCITCHVFAGEKVGTMAAVDLIDSTAQRLRPEWFAHFLRSPFRFKPGTLMPQFFPDGKTVRPELGGGDTKRQIDAMWHYLAQGRNTRQPSGMRRPPLELVVGDDAVLLRRSVQNTGKRGISVGYPLGVNVTFDAERLGLNQIWWGRFVDASPVWRGQGSGEARILGTQVATLPKGPAFVVLPSADAPWPTASRRDLGQQFLGYDLDARQRPTFRYVAAGVTIHDTPRELPPTDAPTGTRPALRRTLEFRGAVDGTLTFLAARDGRIELLGDGEVQVGTSLRLRLPPKSFRIRTVAAERELLVAIALEHGRAELVVDYAWQEAPR